MKAILMAALLASASAHALDLKGVELGQVATCEQLAKLGMDKYTCANGLKLYWEGGTGIEGVPVEVAVISDGAHVVQSISAKFDPDYFGQLLKAAIAKWGPPGDRASQAQANAFGVRVQNVVYTWTMGDGETVTMAKYIDLQHGVLRLAMPATRSAAKDSM